MQLKNDKAVSPIIGILLAVAITVALSGILYWQTSGFHEYIKKSYLVSFTAYDHGDVIKIDYMGGPDWDKLSYIYFTGDAEVIANASNPIYYPKPGDSWEMPDDENKKERIILVGHFNDGSEIILLDTYV